MCIYIYMHIYIYTILYNMVSLQYKKVCFPEVEASTSYNRGNLETWESRA